MTEPWFHTGWDSEDELFWVNIPYISQMLYFTPEELHDLSWGLWRALEAEGFVEEDGVDDAEFEKFRKKLLRSVRG